MREVEVYSDLLDSLLFELFFHAIVERTDRVKKKCNLEGG